MTADARPGRVAWLRYAFGGRLLQHRDWVRHDLLDAGWRWRLLLRVLVQLAVPLVVCALVPLPVGDRLLLVLLVLLAATMTAATAAEQIRNRRLRQHDLPVPEDPDAAYRQRRHY